MSGCRSRNRWSSREVQDALTGYSTHGSQTPSSSDSTTDDEIIAKRTSEPIPGPSGAFSIFSGNAIRQVQHESSSRNSSSSSANQDGGELSDDSIDLEGPLSSSDSDSPDLPLDKSVHPGRITDKILKTALNQAASKSTTPASTSFTNGKSAAESSRTSRLTKKTGVCTRRSRSRVRRVRVRNVRHWKKDIVAAENVKKKPESFSSDFSDEIEYPGAAYYRDEEELQYPVVDEATEHGNVSDPTGHTAEPSTTEIVVWQEPQAGPEVAHSLIDTELEAQLTLHTLISDQQDPDSAVNPRSIKRESNLLRYLRNRGQSGDKYKYPKNANTEQLYNFSAQVAIEFSASLFMFDKTEDFFKFLKPLFLSFWNKKVSPEERVTKEESDRIFKEVEKFTIARCRKMASDFGQAIEDLSVARAKSEAFEKRKTELAEKLKTQREELENGNDDDSVPLNTHQLMKILNPAFAIWKIGQEPNELHEAVLHEPKQRWTTKDQELLKANTLADFPYMLSVPQPRSEDNGEAHRQSWNFSSEGPVVKATKLAKLKRLGEMKQDLEWKFKAKYGKHWAKSKGEVAVRYHRRIPYHHGVVEVEAVPAFKLSANRFKNILTEESNKIKNWQYKDGAAEEISDDVDWEDVAEDMSVLLRKHKTAGDCKLAYKQLVHPSLSDAKWTDEEKERLRVEGEAAAKGKGNWEKVAKNFPGRSAFQCLKQYRLDDVARYKVVWTDEMDEKLLDYIGNNGPNLVGACYHLENPRLTPDDIIYRWSRHINPILRKGDFTILEDVLLILHLVKLRRYMIEDWSYGVLMDYLPWRYETAWRDRADMLFADFIVPWTKKEDQLLLDLAKRMPGKWSKISQYFNSYKTRKNCASRHNRLMERIGNGPDQVKTLDEYHIKYQMYRRKCYESDHLHDVLQVLEWLVEQTSDEIEEFPGFDPTAPPAEWQLKWMVIKFDQGIVKEAVEDLTTYLQIRAEHAPKPTDIRKMFDRRTFKREDPQSVASALHLRGIKLRRPETFVDEPLNEFEKQVWIHHIAFSSTKKPKADKHRQNIPLRAVLINLPEVQRIVIKEDHDVSGEEYEYVPLKRGRPRKVASGSVAASNSAPKSTRAACRAKGLAQGTADTSQNQLESAGPSSASAIAGSSARTAKPKKRRQRQQAASESEPEPVPVRVLKKGKVASVTSEQLKRKRNSQKKAKAQQEQATSTEFESDEAPKARKTQKSGQNQAPVASIGRVLRSRKL